MNEEGQHQTVITSVDVIDLRFKREGQNTDDAFELKFTCQAQDGTTCHTYLEVSSRYGTGNKSNKTQAEITVETLQSIGWTGGYDFSQIGSIVGKPCTINVVKKAVNGKEYLNYYIAGGYSETKIAPDEIARRVARLSSGAQRAPQFGQPQPQQPQTFGQQPMPQQQWPQQNAGFQQPPQSPFGQHPGQQPFQQPFAGSPFGAQR